jgi:CO dehydrogenase nickel-insertion accessory protein CooC1
VVVAERAGILNRCRDAHVAQAIIEELEAAGLGVRAVIPDDPTLAEMAVAGTSLLDVPEDNPAYQAVKRLLSEEEATAAPAGQPRG